jgi:hypothetical protein
MEAGRRRFLKQDLQDDRIIYRILKLGFEAGFSGWRNDSQNFVDRILKQDLQDERIIYRILKLVLKQDFQDEGMIHRILKLGLKQDFQNFKEKFLVWRNDSQNWDKKFCKLFFHPVNLASKPNCKIL